MRIFQQGRFRKSLSAVLGLFAAIPKAAIKVSKPLYTSILPKNSIETSFLLLILFVITKVVIRGFVS